MGTTKQLGPNFCNGILYTFHILLAPFNYFTILRLQRVKHQIDMLLSSRISLIRLYHHNRVVPCVHL